MTTRYLPRRPRPSAPDPMDFGRAMSRHGALTVLGQRLAASQRHLAVISVALPGAMKRFVQAGTLDDAGWTLVADNAAVATKLRHLQPQLLRLLQEEGLLLDGELRIRVRQS
ncbi:DciA family protein [Roseateles amylovorans]|uniref:DciA family protein n=1 Tax=Roseateles amylovorans TaxID=2978473 RepID=A0ABY6B858_9BURK|nr:DciA family protein [Roseateles amylovorans]UXH79745.1 DciA family protein [Roseateles amylovorans]